MLIMDARVHYPIPEEYRRQLIKAGLYACMLRDRGLVDSIEYDRAHAEIERIEARIREKFCVQEGNQ